MNCIHCGEDIRPGERADTIGNDFHVECLFRIGGSLGHQMRLCACYGGTWDDPPGLTKREAARAVYLYNRRLRALEAEFIHKYFPSTTAESSPGNSTPGSSTAPAETKPPAPSAPE